MQFITSLFSDVKLIKNQSLTTLFLDKGYAKVSRTNVFNFKAKKQIG